MSSQPPPKPEPKNDATLARSLGINRQIIAAHRKFHGGECPKGRSIREWKDYLASKGRMESQSAVTGDPNILLETAKRKLSILATKDEREAMNLEKERHELIEWKEVEGICQRLILGLFWAAYDRQTDEWPEKCSGMSAAQMAVYIKREKAKLIKTMQEAVYEFFKVKGPKHDA